MSAGTLPRSTVPKRADYRDYRDDLRKDFHCTCGYCSIWESEAEGIGFEIDHYLPKEGHPDLVNDFLNLVWSCRPCNRYKWDWDPNDPRFKPDEIVFRPDQHVRSEHFAPAPNYEISGTTQLGLFTCRRLRLNRPLLKRLRECRERDAKAERVIKDGLRRVRGLAHKIDSVPPELRGDVLRLRAELEQAATEIHDAVDEIIPKEPRSRLY